MDSVNKCTVGIIAGSLGHWVVNKESKMVEMLLRSCQKGINKNNMSKNQKVKLNQHGMGDQGEIINFSIFFRILFFSIFLQFLMHFLIPSGTNFITNMESVSKKKKSKTLSVSLGKCQQEAITQYWFKSANILKIVLFVSNFSAPNTVRSSRN